MAGYLYQNDQSCWTVLPFYEKRSYTNQSHKSSYGVRGEYAHWLSTASEYAKNNYDDYYQLNGNSVYYQYYSILRFGSVIGIFLV
ncbi:MAG: surface lipoprotein assembly modifier [Moraxella sp.]